MDLSAARYEIIKPLLDRYRRRFTVLDLGAGINPYMAQRISREFDTCVVAVEQNEIVQEELERFGPRALWLRKKMSARDLEHLSFCEHFDVVLALNVLHHFGEEWRGAMDTLTLLGDWVVVQTPMPQDQDACGAVITPEVYHATHSSGAFLGSASQFEGHLPRPIYLIESSWKPRLVMSSWTSPEACIDAQIVSDFDNKTIELRHKGTPPQPFVCGLNLWNFAQLGGAQPRKNEVLQLIREFLLPAEPHGDITAHNFLFDGVELYLIDGHEGWQFDDNEGIVKTMLAIEEALA